MVIINYFRYITLGYINITIAKGFLLHVHKLLIYSFWKSSLPF